MRPSVKGPAAPDGRISLPLSAHPLASLPSQDFNGYGLNMPVSTLARARGNERLNGLVARFEPGWYQL